jgi:hypothetical protein
MELYRLSFIEKMIWRAICFEQREDGGIKG